MRRTLIALLAFAGLLAVPAFASPQAGERPPLKASLAACSIGPKADQRFAIFTGSMPAYRGTRRMAMRFDLYIRPIGARGWTRVRSRGLGTWQRSDPGREGWVYTKRVERLRQGHEYRVRVRFRWYQSPSTRRRDRVRRTPVCRQPDQRPNLEIQSLDIRPGDSEATRRYAVTVRNTGRTGAEAFDVSLSTTRVDTAHVAGLPAGERTTVELLAPACPMGDRVIARADPSDVVDESAERDNRFIGLCDGR